MAAEFLHHAIAVRLCMRFDHRTDIAETRTRLAGGLDAEHEAFVGHVDQLAGLERRLTGEIHAARIAVPAVDQRGHVDIDDIAVLQGFLARDAVADDMIDRGAAAVSIAAIAHRCRNGARIEHHAANLVVDLARGHTGRNKIGQLVEDFSGKASGLTHALETFRPVELDGPVTIDGLVAVDYLIFGHARPCSDAARELRERQRFTLKALAYSGFTASITEAVTGKLSS